jgi:DNA polymerase V
MSFRTLQKDQRENYFSSVKNWKGELRKGFATASQPCQLTPKSSFYASSMRQIRFNKRPIRRQFGRLHINDLSLPFFINFVPAGYPSNIDDPLKRHLDLSRYLIRHPKSTYYFKVTGYAMTKAGINHNDLLVVDTALKPKHRDIVIVVLNGELLLKRLHIEGSQVKLLSANSDFPTIIITKDMSFFVQGVVTTVIRTFNPLPYDNHFKDISYLHS